MTEEDNRRKLADFMRLTPYKFNDKGEITFLRNPDMSKYVEHMERIWAKDPDMCLSLTEILEYLASTYDERYANSELRNEGIIYSEKLGKGFNMGNAAKYIARYITTGFSKSEMPDDLKKTVHYVMFEYVRKTKKK